MSFSPLESLSNLLVRFEKTFPNVIGYIWGTTSMAIYITSNLLVKSLSKDLPYSQILFFRSLSLVVYPYLFMVREKMQFHYKSVTINRLLMIRGFVGTAGIVLTYYALTLLPLSDVSVLAQVYPVMTGLLAVPILGEKYEISQLLSALICMVGVILIAKPTFIFGSDASLSPISSPDRIVGSIALLLSGLSQAVVEVLVRKVGNRTNVGVTTIAFGIISTMIASSISLSQGIVGLTWQQAHCLLWIGVLSFVFQMIRNRAFMLGNAGRISNTAYTGIVFGYILDIFILGTEINIYSLFGAVCIFSCLFIYIAQLYRKGKNA